MIYLDTSVALAHLLAEEPSPPPVLWGEVLVSSRLLEVEIWTRLHARGLAKSHGEAAREMVARIALVELVPPVVARAREPFPRPVRTLDALHLATAELLKSYGQALRIATYDLRMREAAAAMEYELL